MKHLIGGFLLVLLFYGPVSATEKRIIHTWPDGSVAVTVPALGYIAKLMAQGMTEDEAVEAVRDKDMPAGAMNVRIVDRTDLPASLRFHDAWRLNGLVIEVDMPLARGIHAERIARAQAAEIARLKVEERSERLKNNIVKADTHAATVTALEALNLNTLATQIAAAPNATALKAIWPANVPR